MAERCAHFDQIRDVTPSARGCEDCLALGDAWIGLRLCLTCGHVGCCDDSTHMHATAHYNETQHPLIRSLEPGETWGWCYVDKLMFEKMPGSEGRTLLTRLRGLFGRDGSA